MNSKKVSQTPRGKIVYEAWLLKQDSGSSTYGSWVRCYFVLREDGTFYGYKSEVNSATNPPEYQYHIDECEVLILIENGCMPFSFSMTPLKNSTFKQTFSAESAIEREEWISALRSLVRTLSTISPLMKAIKNAPETESITMNTTVLNDFELEGNLGKGSYGEVGLYRKIITGELLAIKKISSKTLWADENCQELNKYVLTEYRVLKIDHPFLISFKECFIAQEGSNESLCFVTEFANGGTLRRQLSCVKKFKEEDARFYAAEITLAVTYLHSLDIIHRDLKLENILVAGDGHIKLIDFGTCKENIPYGAMTGSFRGTDLYMAPEIFNNMFGDNICAYNGRAADWWSLGVIIYEMLVGDLPFHAHDYNRIGQAVQTGVVHYPDFIGKNAKDLLQGLLMKKVNRRLGSHQRDGEEVINHKFFAAINRQNLEKKWIAPPFIPQLELNKLTKYFAVLPYPEPQNRSTRATNN